MMRWLVARRFPRVLTLTAHLDTTKTIPDPQDGAKTIPDPAWTLSRSWDIPPRRQGETAGAYQTRAVAWATATRDEFVKECNARLAELTDALDAGVALPFEGATF